MIRLEKAGLRPGLFYRRVSRDVASSMLVLVALLTGLALLFVGAALLAGRLGVFSFSSGCLFCVGSLRCRSRSLGIFGTLVAHLAGLDVLFVCSTLIGHLTFSLVCYRGRHDLAGQTGNVVMRSKVISRCARQALPI